MGSKVTYKRENATGLLVSGSERLYNPLLLHLCSCVQSQREAVVEEFIYKAKPLEAMVVLNAHKQQARVRHCYKISSRVLILNTLFTGK